MKPEQIELLKKLIAEHDRITSDQRNISDPSSIGYIKPGNGDIIYLSKEETASIVENRVQILAKGLEAVETSMSEIFGSPLV